MAQTARIVEQFMLFRKHIACQFLGENPIVVEHAGALEEQNLLQPRRLFPF
jgi:hypothetical protein